MLARFMSAEGKGTTNKLSGSTTMFIADKTVLATTLPYNYNLGLVVISYLVAAFASFATGLVAATCRPTRAPGRRAAKG